MPVDLSKIGLEGMESYYSQQESKSRTEYNNVLASAGRAKLDTDARNQNASQLASLAVQNHEAVDGESGAIPLEIAGRTFLENGAPEMGGDFLKQASEIREKEGSARKNAVDQMRIQSELTLKTADYTDNLMAGVDSPESFDFTVSGLERAQAAGEISLPAGTTEKMREYGYSPELIKIYRSHSIKAKDQALLDLRSQNLEQSKYTRNMIDAQAARTYQLQLARERNQQEWRRQMLAKGGANKPSALIPNNEQVNIVRKSLIGTIFQGADPKKSTPSLDLASNYVASDALQRMANSKGSIPWALAVQQSTTQAIADGVIDRKERPSEDGRPRVYVNPNKGLGKTPNTALAPPRLPDGRADTSKMRSGTHYLGEQGKVFLWNGKTPTPVQ